MEFLRQYEVLFKKGRSDLKAAKTILKAFENGDEELDLEIIMFHLQQCGEKLLKSLLAYNGFHFTKTHNIGHLIDAIHNNQISIIPDIDKLIPLTEFAVEGRYAIIHDDLEGADKFIVILDELLAFVKSAITIE